MIYTITSNPALDLGGMVDGIVPNEKNYVYEETRYPGGNAINAARILTRLNIPVTATGFLGGSVGEEVRSLLTAEGVRSHFIRIQDDTRINVTVSCKNTHQQTRLAFPGPHLRKSELARLFSRIRSIRPPTILVIGGSMPPGGSTSHLKLLLRIAAARSIPCIVDVPAQILRPLLPLSPLLVKPNLCEFHELTSTTAATIASVTREANKIRGKIPLFCISSVEDGALLVTPWGTWFAKGPQIRVKSTVGAGDSMIGAMTAALWKQNVRRLPLASGTIDPAAILKLGLAAAFATIATPGTTLGESATIRAFFTKIRIERVR